jgi:predicted phage baseplate assembly protein
MALIEAFAYMGDISNYYIDRIANESSITTATQRESILAIAETYGYVPSGYQNALIDITFYNNSTTAGGVTVPAGTRVSGNVTVEDAVYTVTFTTKLAVTVPAFASGVRGQAIAFSYEGISNTVEAGSVYGALLGSSNGQPDQSYVIEDFPVVSDSIDVYVQSGVTYKKWTEVKHLLDYGPNDTVYSTRLDKDNNVYVLFGDGVSGAIPTRLASIRAAYIIGGGVLGNISTAVVDTITYVPGLSEAQVIALNGTLDVSNTSNGLGGSEPESDSSIRNNAPAYLNSQNRAVTLADIENLSLSVNNCGKARAIASSWSAITLYVAPSRDINDSDATPGLVETATPGVYEATVEWTSLRDEIKTYLADKLLIGTSLTVVKPTYKPIYIGVNFTLDPTYTSEDAIKNMKKALLDNFSYNYVAFGDTVNAEDIVYVLQGVAGCKKPRVTFLYITGGTPSIADITAADYEILTFAENDIIIAAV